MPNESNFTNCPIDTLSQNVMFLKTNCKELKLITGSKQVKNNLCLEYKKKSLKFSKQDTFIDM